MTDPMIEKVALAIKRATLIQNDVQLSRPGPWRDYEISAAVAAIEAAFSWQPIETAPKDGTFILMMCKGAEIPAVVQWTESGWKECGDADDYVPVWSDPESWMPLPVPPKTT